MERRFRWIPDALGLEGEIVYTESGAGTLSMALGNVTAARADSHLPTFSPAHFRNLIIAGPAPAPLLRAETFYRYQLMLRTRAMSRLSLALAQITTSLALPQDVTLTVDVDPVALS